MSIPKSHPSLLVVELIMLLYVILKLVEFRKQFNTKEFIPPKSSTKESALFIFDEDLKRNLSITMDIDTSFKDISISLNVQDFNFKRKLKRINHYFEDSMYIKSNDFDYLLTKMYKILNYIKEIV